jgi:hypothetical protein
LSAVLIEQDLKYNQSRFKPTVRLALTVFFMSSL